MCKRESRTISNSLLRTCGCFWLHTATLRSICFGSESPTEGVAMAHGSSFGHLACLEHGFVVLVQQHVYSLQQRAHMSSTRSQRTKEMVFTCLSSIGRLRRPHESYEPLRKKGMFSKTLRRCNLTPCTHSSRAPQLRFHPSFDMGRSSSPMVRGLRGRALRRFTET